MITLRIHISEMQSLSDCLIAIVCLIFFSYALKTLLTCNTHPDQCLFIYFAYFQNLLTAQSTISNVLTASVWIHVLFVMDNGTVNMARMRLTVVSHKNM